MCQPWKWFLGLLPLALVALLALYFKPDPIQADLSVRSSQDLSTAGHGWASVTVDGRELTLSGTAPSEAAQLSAREVVAGIWGVRTVNDTTSLLALADPFVFKARLENGRVTLSGNVPSTDARSQLSSAAKAVLPGAEIDTQGLAAARGVPGLDEWRAATSFALKQLSGLASGEVSLNNLAYSIIGEAASAKSYESLISDLDALPKGVTLAAESVTAPVVSPHRLDAAYDGKVLELSGVAPDFAARDALLAAAKSTLPQARVKGEVAIAGGGIESATWSRGTSYALQQFARMSKAAASLEDGKLSISGEAASVEDYESVQAALAAIPAGIELVSADILPAAADTFAWTASLDDSGVMLGGFVPSEAARAAIAENAAKSFPEIVIGNRMRVAKGPDEASDDAWVAGSGFALGQLTHLEEGRAVMTPGSLSLSGTARTPEDFDAVNAALALLPEGFDLGSNSVLPPIVDPFTWSATLANDGVTMDGYAPTIAIRNGLVDVFGDARPGTEVRSTVKVSRGPLAGARFSEVAGYTARMFALFSDGEARLEGDVYSLSGTARDVDAFKAAKSALEKLPADVKAGELSVTPAAIGVLSWTATRDQNQIVLDGFVPSEAVRKSVVKAAEQSVPGAVITDRMEVASGGPEAAIWGNATAFALKQLGRMTRGQARLSGSDFSLEGIAPDFDAYDGILADVPGAMPGGLQLVRADILPPSLSPYVWGAKRDQASLTLHGHVPSEAVRAEIVAFARERFSALDVKDQMRLASGAPEGMVQAVGVAFGALGNLDAGAVSLVDRRLTLTGDAPDEEARGAAEELISKRLPTGFAGTSSIRVVARAPDPAPSHPSQPPQAQECQDRLNQVMSGNIIQFEVNQAAIRSESFGVLDRLADVAKSCSGFSIEVAGHTDSDGPEDYNQKLSQDRANAVVRYLVKAGVSEVRLKAVGYGESKPIASNDNEAGKARNRRIEFNIIQ